MTNKQLIVDQAEQYVKEQLGQDSSGHDWWHIQRVRGLAGRLAEEEGANPLVCELAALLHDVADVKLNPSKEAGLRKVQNWLESHAVATQITDHVMQIISTMSYNGGHNPPMASIEGQVVQDADRLDAMGAIGIARTFVYSGWTGRPMHDPSCMPREDMTEEEYRSNKGTAVLHFYEKLLKLKDRMNTVSGKALALERHTFMVTYLEQFYKEWEGAK